MIKICFTTETNKGNIKIYFGMESTNCVSRGKYEASSCTILLCAPRISVFYKFREPYAVEWILQMPVTASIRFRTGCIEKRDTQVGRHRMCGGDTGIVLASTWLETLELSLSREWRPYTAHTFHSADSATAILLTTSRPDAFTIYFKFVEFNSPLWLYVYVCSPNSFRIPFPAFFPFPLRPLTILSKVFLAIPSFRRKRSFETSSLYKRDSHKEKRFKISDIRLHRVIFFTCFILFVSNILQSLSE